jgi:hypothetical protein
MKREIKIKVLEKDNSIILIFEEQVIFKKGKSITLKFPLKDES